MNVDINTPTKNYIEERVSIPENTYIKTKADLYMHLSYVKKILKCNETSCESCDHTICFDF